MLISEYGADTLPGLHLLPAFIWTEEFQTQLFSKHFEAFDELRNEGIFIGEFVWNFADFQTQQGHNGAVLGMRIVIISFPFTLGINRLNGNKKGVFTRNRQPKAAAHLLRQRYFDLAMEVDGFNDQPADVDGYISPIQEKLFKTEL